jgi:hypothetical protein
MPFKWEQGKNPFIYNYFGILRIGPNTTQKNILEYARKLKQLLTSGERLELAGHPLDEHAIDDASRKLHEPVSQSEELLLVHPQPQWDNKKRMKSLVGKLRETALFPEDRSPPPLLHPLALCWFIPAPGAEAAELPEWSAFGLVEPGEGPDLELDIVFDS